MERDKILEILLERMEEVRDAVTNLESRLAERCPIHAKRLDRVELILDGSPANGKAPGLIARVGTIEDAIKRLHRAKTWAFMVTGAIIGGVVVAVIEKVL
jgi:hypothetical protein